MILITGGFTEKIAPLWFGSRLLIVSSMTSVKYFPLPRSFTYCGSQLPHQAVQVQQTLSAMTSFQGISPSVRSTLDPALFLQCSSMSEELIKLLSLWVYNGAKFLLDSYCSILLLVLEKCVMTQQWVLCTLQFISAVWLLRAATLFILRNKEKCTVRKEHSSKISPFMWCGFYNEPCIMYPSDLCS